MMMMTLKSLCRIRAVGWEKMAEATPQMIGLIIIVLTLDFYSLAEKTDVQDVQILMDLLIAKCTAVIVWLFPSTSKYGKF